MVNYNKCLFMGHMVRDVELKLLPGTQMSIAKFTIAVNHRVKKGEQQHDEVCFLDCEAFGRLGEEICRSTGKGKPIFVEGRLKLDQWSDKSGQKRTKHKLVVEEFDSLERPPEQDVDAVSQYGAR